MLFALLHWKSKLVFRTWIRETIHRRKIGKMRLTAVIYNTALRVQTQIHNKSFLARIHTGRQPRNLPMSCPCMFFSKENRNVSNCKSEKISSDFQMSMFESNLKIDVTNLKPHASRTHLKIWRVRDSNMLFWTSENTPIFWTSDFQIWRIWSTQIRP